MDKKRKKMSGTEGGREEAEGHQRCSDEVKEGERERKDGGWTAERGGVSADGRN